jgi:MEDS: MEthanogen/methylotroph, DcmR Sensory domain
MPVFECARCNNLTYSASRFASISCDICGGARQRVLEHAFSFDEARDEPRNLTHGDHCCCSFTTPEEAAPLCAHVIRAGLAENARVMVFVKAELADAITAQLTPEEAQAVEFGGADDVYGPGFDPDETITRFRAIAAEEQRPVYVLGGARRPLDTLVDREAFERYERMATETAVELGMVVICLYEEGLHAHSHVTVRDATHPLTTEGGPVRRNADFVFSA